MSSELRFLKGVIGRDEQKSKLANEMKDLSVDELSTVIKEANGDMLQYFQDHPEKLKEKQKRDAAKSKEKKASEEKKTSLVGDTARGAAKGGAVGAAVGAAINGAHNRGAMHAALKDSAIKASPHAKEIASEAGNLKALATGVGMGRGIRKGLKYGLPAGAALGAIKHFSKKKEASLEAVAEQWGRELAKEAAFGVKIPHAVTPEMFAQVAAAGKKSYKLTNLSKGILTGGAALAAKKALTKKKEAPQEKTAAPDFSKLVGSAARLVEKHGPGARAVAGKAGKAAYNGVKNVGTRIGNIKDPITKGVAAGSAIGGIGGAAQGFLDPKEDPFTGKKKRLQSAYRKGMAGAVSGALVGSVSPYMKTSSVALLEKAAAGLTGLGGIGAMAGNFVKSMAPTAKKAMGAAAPMAQKALGAAKPMAQKAMAAAKPMVQQGAKALGGASMGQAAAVGAGAGAALGAAKGAIAPGVGANGQKNSRLGGMARGAVGGAAVGGALGAGAKAGLPHAMKRLG